MTALHQFGAEMLKLSRGLESFAPITDPISQKNDEPKETLETNPTQPKPSFISER